MRPAPRGGLLRCRAMPTHRLIGLAYSPWSIKAKWALDHHAIPYRYAHYLPMLGEPLLRLRTQRLRGRVSVPVLVTEAGPIEGSLEIARFAEREGSGAPLFPAGREQEIERWNARSEVMLDAGRALSMRRMLRSRAALTEQVPGGRALGPLGWAAGALGVRFVAGKYVTDVPDEDYREELRAGLLALRAAIGSNDYLLGALSYADIAMAVTLAFVKPLGAGRDHLGDATRAVWTEDELAAELADVVAWRDRIYERDRPRSRQAA